MNGGPQVDEMRKGQRLGPIYLMSMLSSFSLIVSLTERGSFSKVQMRIMDLTPGALIFRLF